MNKSERKLAAKNINVAYKQLVKLCEEAAKIELDIELEVNTYSGDDFSDNQLTIWYDAPKPEREYLTNE